jgi:pSer/pThr/pTyr-binding forkhead associated (FHA) protein
LNKNIPEIILGRIQDAFLRYLRDRRIPYTECRIIFLETLITPENREYLQGFVQLDAADRNYLAKRYLMAAVEPGTVNFDDFYGWEIKELENLDESKKGEYVEEIFNVERKHWSMLLKFDGGWKRPDPDRAARKEALLTLEISSRAGTRRHEVSSLRDLPLCIGRAEYNDIALDNETVSRENLRIGWDETERRYSAENLGDAALVVDRRPLAKGERRLLYQQGELVIAPDGGNEVMIRYQRPYSPQNDTPTLLVTSAQKPPAPGRAIPTVEGVRSAAVPGRAEPTFIVPLAYLDVQYPDERAPEEVAVTALPLEIGREPDADGGQAVLISDDAGNTVSRRHLRIERSGAACFLVENRGFEKSGTFCGDDEMPRQFTLDPAEGKWLTLGNKAVQIRLRLPKDLPPPTQE